MSYETRSIEQLINSKKQLESFIRQSQNLVSMQGGWMFWDGDKEDEAKKQLREVNAELAKRNETTVQ